MITVCRTPSFAARVMRMPRRACPCVSLPSSAGAVLERAVHEGARAAKELGFEEQTWRLAGVGWNVQARSRSSAVWPTRMGTAGGPPRALVRAGPRWSASSACGHKRISVPLMAAAYTVATVWVVLPQVRPFYGRCDRV